MLRVAAHFGRHAIFHGHQHCAGIGTIMRAGGTHYGGRHRQSFSNVPSIGFNRTAKFFFSGMKLRG
jgi:hypothetical protein